MLYLATARYWIKFVRAAQKAAEPSSDGQGQAAIVQIMLTGYRWAKGGRILLGCGRAATVKDGPCSI